MWLQYTIIALVFLIGVVLAFPTAIAICALLGGLLSVVDRLITCCLQCGERRMHWTNGIRETYPTGRGTGRFYFCSACGQRSFWSNDGHGWQDASDASFDWAFVER